MSKNYLHSISSYLKYFLQSKTKHSVHSPFVFELITKVFENKESNVAYEQVYKVFKELIANSRVLETTDFGSDKGRMNYMTRFLTVSSIARSSSINRKNGELLYRLVESLHPLNVLELGTALGISTLYISKAAPEAKIFTIEGCAAKVELARSNFAKQSASNIEVYTGRFDTQLPGVLSKMDKIDFVFMDGHHHYKPTLDYFNQILKQSHDGTVIVLDDIHWSPGMEKAWKKIQNLPEVMVTIDLYRMGLVFLRKSLSKQQFIIRY
jgi:predicted O-methyltransferase YrrM